MDLEERECFHVVFTPPKTLGFWGAVFTFVFTEKRVCPIFPNDGRENRVTPSFWTTSLHQNRGENLPPTRSSGSLNHQTGGSEVLKVLIGVGLGFFLFTNPDARQITGDLLRAAGNAIAPPIEGKDAPTIQERITDVPTGQDQE